MTVKPKISIITVNYRTSSDTEELLECLEKCHYPNLEVWVIDNGSPEPPRYLASRFPQFHFIFSEKNLGFAGGNNLGIEQCTGDLILLLNNDTLVQPDFLDAIPSLFESDPSIGMIGCRLMYASEPGIVQFAGSKGMNPYTGRSFSIGWKEKDQEAFHQNYPSSHAHGAALCVKREVIEKIGLMWEGYFLYYEELDFCERTKRAGYQIWYCGESEVQHKESMSTGKDSPLKTYYLNRNRLVFIRRNRFGLQKYSALLFYACIALPKNVLTLLLKGEGQRAQKVLEAFAWNLTHFHLGQNKRLA
ncbi:MAG: glycosyltransferase family 2 protein [Bacteroidota bacterium]|nr:glycosyltransferase family 2 protein [Bacteroidota bacterium]MDX5429875.1 glycosyltransferase family 2 protein [Bacteroidota bacterium]MDX5468653.1 glycosyltransferase family 2 protein [Bacteroidota bacterium]